MSEIIAVLRTEYGIIADEITPATGGWSAAAYKVESKQGRYFLKEYDKKRIGTAIQLEKLDLCMKAAAWLENNTGLKSRINAPLLTLNGNIRAETQNYAYLLFVYIDGITPRETPLSLQQQKEIAAITGELHRYGADIPLDFSSVKETFEIPCDELIKMPGKPKDPLCLSKHYNMLMFAINWAKEMALNVKSADLPFVLCHTDIHGWNLMQSDRLILIDWESIKLAPAEADLYTFWGDWYWGDFKWGSYWDTFLPIYQKLHPEYIFRKEVLMFYQIRRHIEDINEFYREYIYDDITEEVSREIINNLKRECSFLSTLV